MDLSENRRILDIIEHGQSKKLFELDGQRMLGRKELEKLFTKIALAAQQKKAVGSVSSFDVSDVAQKGKIQTSIEDRMKSLFFKSQKTESSDDIRHSLGILREIEQIDEFNPLSTLRRKKQDVLSKYGHQKSKLEVGARKDADALMANWEKLNITPTISNIMKWMEKNNVHADVIKAGFEGLGISDDNVDPKLADTSVDDGVEDDIENQGLEVDFWNEWDAYKQEKGAPEGPTVQMVKDFVQSKEAELPDRDIARALELAGAKSTVPSRGLTKAVAQQAIADLLGIELPSDEQAEVPTLTDKQEAKGETIGQASGQDVQDQLDDEGVSDEDQQKIFQDSGVDPNTPEIGDDGAEALAKSKTGTAPREEPGDVGDGGGSTDEVDETDDIISMFSSNVQGSNIQKAAALAKEARGNGGKGLDDLEKLGAAYILTKL